MKYKWYCNHIRNIIFESWLEYLSWLQPWHGGRGHDYQHWLQPWLQGIKHHGESRVSIIVIIFGAQLYTFICSDRWVVLYFNDKLDLFYFDPPKLCPKHACNTIIPSFSIIFFMKKEHSFDQDDPFLQVMVKGRIIMSTSKNNVPNKVCQIKKLNNLGKSLCTFIYFIQLFELAHFIYDCNTIYTSSSRISTKKCVCF